MCELRACPDCAEVYGHLEKFIHAEATLSVFKGLVTVENSFRVFFEVPLSRLWPIYRPVADPASSLAG